MRFHAKPGNIVTDPQRLANVRRMFMHYPKLSNGLRASGASVQFSDLRLACGGCGHLLPEQSVSGVVGVRLGLARIVGIGYCPGCGDYTLVETCMGRSCIWTRPTSGWVFSMWRPQPDADVASSAHTLPPVLRSVVLGAKLRLLFVVEWLVLNSGSFVDGIVWKSMFQ